MKISREYLESQREKYRQTGVFWNRSVSFNPDLVLAEKHRDIARSLYQSLNIKAGYKDEQRQVEFETVLANLLWQTRKPINISLSSNDWVRSRYNKLTYFTVTLVKRLHEMELIEMKKGYYFAEESRMTRIEPTEKLLAHFPEYKNSVVMIPSEVVLLHDSQGKLKDYKDTADTWRIRRILRRVNEVNARAVIKYSKYTLNAFLAAIFVERFTWYGRLHTQGFMHYQGLSGEERQELTINGDAITELDYSGLHPNLLYAAEGIQLSADPYMVVDQRPELRPFLKLILLCMINSKDVITAERAANYWLKMNPGEREQLKEIGVTRARPFIDKFFEAHQPIAHHFCHGKATGMRIMNRDARIALDVVNHFAKHNIPILAIHDSFIVQRQWEDELREVMAKVYQKHTGHTIKIKIA